MTNYVKSIRWYICHECNQWGQDTNLTNVNQCRHCGHVIAEKSHPPDFPSGTKFPNSKLPVYMALQHKGGVQVRSFIPETNEEIGVVTASYEEIYKAFKDVKNEN